VGCVGRYEGPKGNSKDLMDRAETIKQSSLVTLKNKSSHEFKVARFFLVQRTRTGKIYQNDHKMYQVAIKPTE
jgi:hypothetical protein